ncbi:hypothetical protein KR038_011021, partial [Drosophila bunnanda]
TFALAASGILSLLFVASALGGVIEDFEYLSVEDMCGLLPQDTSLLRPSTCDNWVRCPNSLEAAVEQGACASGLYYDKDLGRCILATSAKCPYTGVGSVDQVKNYCANETDGSFVVDPSSSDCRGYILCKNGKQMRANCPNELVFQPTSRSCVYEKQYQCPKSSAKRSDPACRSLPNNTRLADPVHCDQYYECVNELLHIRSCPALSAYDVALGYCMNVSEVACYETAALPEPENTFCLDEATGSARVGYFADDLSCAHYYICNKPKAGKHDTEPRHLSCPLGQYFDFEKLSCRDRLNVRCQLDRCVGTNLTYVNVAGDCQSYGRCSGGVTVSTGHCPTGYYFDERNQGCSLTNYHYIACSA